MAKETKSVRFSDKAKNIIINYPTSCYNADFTCKIEEIVNTSFDMIRYTKKELVGIFSETEAKLIVDCMNGTLYTSNINPKAVLLCNVEDSILLDGLDAKWDVDKNTIVSKINSLTEYQSYVILTMAFDFWSSDEPDLNDVPKIFLCKIDN